MIIDHQTSVEATPLYQEIHSWLINELEKHADVTIQPDGDVSFLKEGLLDSMGLLKFIVKVQRQFNVVFSPEQMNDQSLNTVKSLALTIHRLSL